MGKESQKKDLPREGMPDKYPCPHNEGGHEKFRQAGPAVYTDAGTVDGWVATGSHEDFCKHCMTELAK